MGKPTEQGVWFDSISDFRAGMNSDVPPIDLAKNQLSFATNGTLRGNYFMPRPPHNDIALSFPDLTVQTNFESGLFQFGSYYKPDFGAESIIVAIGGRLFNVTPSQADSTATVTDISIVGDLNSPAIGQSWLWRGENYLFCNNGEAGMLYFDGNLTRRSDVGTLVGTTSGAVAIPAIGNSVSVNLTTAYTGAYGIAVQVFPSATSDNVIGQFQINPSGGSYTATLTNVTDVPGTSHAAGEEVESNPSFIGRLTAPLSINSVVGGGTTIYSPTIDTAYNWPDQAPYAETWSLVDSSGVARTFLSWGAPGWTHPPGRIDMSKAGPYPAMIFSSGTVVKKVGAPATSTVAVLTASFSAPAIGDTVQIQIEGPYTGVNDAVVYIGGAKYTIVAGTAPSSTTVQLEAISLSQATGSIPSGAVLKTLPQLPVGRMGEYGLGRNWISLADGISYIASDIVGGSSGTLVNHFRDSILNVTENNYLAGGGVFHVPSSGQSIKALRFPATLDSSLGQGPLQVLTQTTTFSCNAPVQRALWQDLTNPIQTQSLVGGGALSQYSTVLVNGDIWFRSIDGIRSLKLARQDFQTSYGNTPQSVEMNRVLLEDNRSLLGLSSAIVFDNRMLMTATPTQSSGGVYHSKLIALNLDPISSLRGKEPPIYDGAWEGLNVLQLITGTFSGIDRAFAFVYDTTTNNIGLAEILPTSTSNLFDNGTERIVSYFESPALFYQAETASRQLLRLNDGEIMVKDLSGDVRFDVYYRPDFDTNWHPWHSWEVSDSPSWQPRMGLGQPDLKAGDSATGRPYAVGYHFQVKVVITGSVTILGLNFYAVGQPTPQFARPLTALTPLPT